MNINRNTLMSTVTLQDAIKFLEEDPYSFGSGYIKENLWKHILHFKIDKIDNERLQNVALKYIEKKMTREFRYMCHAMSQIAEKSFWNNVATIFQTTSFPVQKRAGILFGYKKGIIEGDKNRKAFDLEILMKKFPQLTALFKKKKN